MEDSPADSPKIRKMVQSDLDRIVEIDIKILGKPRPAYYKMKLALDEKRPENSSLVVELGGKVVGFIIGYASRWEYGVSEKIGWVDTIGVDPDYQRKGIAKILFQEMARSLKEAGIETIYTFVTRRDWRLLKFFNSMGFQRGDLVNLELDI